MPLEHVAHDLPDAAVADDDGVPGLAVRRRDGELRLERLALFQRSAMRRAASARSGISAMVSEVDGQREAGDAPARSPSVVAMPMATNANSPPGPSSRPVSIAAGRGTRNSRARPVMSTALMATRPDHRGEQPERLARQLAHIDAHADGEEEHAEQQALERLDRRLDGLAELGLGQQQAGDERAERHRQAGDPAVTPVPTMTNRVAATNSSVAPAVATSRNSGRSSSRPTTTMSADGQCRMGERQRQAGEHRAAGARAQNRDEQQQRHHGEVLRQQDREARPAGSRGQTAAGWTAPR